MSLADRTSGLFDRVTERLNPILVKETRQSTQSKLFATVFMLFLAISWMVLVFGTLSMWNTLETQATAEVFFGWYFAVLSFACFVVVPFGAYRSLLAEREQNTYDLLTITALRPQQIVWGKLASSMLQVLVYYSAILPFIAFTSVLQGFDILWVGWVLMMSLLWSLVLCMGALTTSVVSRLAQWQTTNLVGLIVMLLFGWGMALTLTIADGGWRRGLVEPAFWWTTGVIVVVCLSYVALAQQVTVAHLTFAAGNRSTGIRLVLVAQFWMLVGLVLVLWLCGYSSIDETAFHVTILGLAATHWAFTGLFQVTDSDFLSRRIRKRLPRSRFVRYIAALYLPGGSRGLALVVLHLFFLCLGMIPLCLMTGTDDLSTLLITFVLVANIVVWIGLAAAMARLVRRASYRITAAHVRVMTVVFFIVVQLVTWIPSFLNSTDWGGTAGFRWLSAWNTIQMMAQAAESNGSVSAYGGMITWNSALDQEFVVALWLLAATAVVALIGNLPAMVRGIRQVVFDPGPEVEAAQSGDTVTNYLQDLSRA